jgi:hypothetical protein
MSSVPHVGVGGVGASVAVGTDEGANVDGAAVVGTTVGAGVIVGAGVNGTTNSCESLAPKFSL